MSSPTNFAEFKFWELSIPKNSEKKLKMENENTVYHVSNATLGNDVSEGRTTVYFKTKGKKAPICNLINNTLENASLDFIVSRSMNPSFMTKGSNAVFVSGYVQPLVEESDSENAAEVNVAKTDIADVANAVKVTDGKVSAKTSNVQANMEPENENVDVKDEVKRDSQEGIELKAKEESKSTPKEEVKPATKEEAKLGEEPATIKEDTASKKRKLHEVQSSKGNQPPEKKPKKKSKKKKKKHLKTKDETSAIQNNSSGEPIEVEKSIAEKPVVEETETKNKEDKDIVMETKESQEPMEVDEAPVAKSEDTAKVESKAEDKSKKEEIDTEDSKLEAKPSEVEKVLVDNSCAEEKESKSKEVDAGISKLEAQPMEKQGELKTTVEESLKGTPAESQPEVKLEEQEKKVEEDTVKGKPAEQTQEKGKAATASKPKSKSSKKSKKSKKMIKAGKGVTYRVLKKGNAGVNIAKKGDTITLLYVGCLKDGKQFDVNLKEGLTFKLGGEEVIPGIEFGVYGMAPKEKRRIIIPPDQGYGEEGNSEGQIPPNAELHFTVQRK